MADHQASSPWYALDKGTARGDILQQSQYFRDVPLLSQLLDAVPDIVLVINDQGRIVFANRALGIWLGLDDHRIIYGQLTGQALGCVHASVGNGCGTREVCRTCGAAQAIFSGLHGKHAVNECRITQRSGQALDLRVLASPLDFNDDVYSVFTLQDIGDEKRRHALERIFYHDILNIAGTLTLASHSLSTSKEPKRLEMIQDIIRQVSERLVEIIKSSRDLSRAERGELQPSFSPVNSGQILERVCSFYSMNDFAGQRTLVIAPDSGGCLLRERLGAAGTRIGEYGEECARSVKIRADGDDALRTGG